MGSFLGIQVPENWKQIEKSGWRIKNAYPLENVEVLPRNIQLQLLSYFGFCPPSEHAAIAKLPSLDFTPLMDQARDFFDLTDEGYLSIPFNSNSSPYKISLRNPLHDDFFLCKLVHDGFQLFADPFFHPLSHTLYVSLTATVPGSDSLFSIEHADQLSLADAFDYVKRIQNVDDFFSFKTEFEHGFAHHDPHHLTRQSLESLIQGMSGKIDTVFITQLESTIHGLTRVDIDLNPYSKNVASRVYFPDGSAVFKICNDSISAQREVALISAAQLDPYLAPFIPKLLDNHVYEYNGSSMFIMQDRRTILDAMPTFVGDHFSYVNNHNPSLKAELFSSSDFKTYLTALFHWRGRELKDSLPQVLFTSSYLSFPQIESRLGNFGDANIQSQLNYLSGIYPEAVDLLEHALYTTLLHRDMKPENIVFNQNKKSGLIPMSIIDFGDASTGPGIFDTVRLFNDKLSSSITLSEYNHYVQRQTKLYLAFMNSFSNLGKVDSAELDSTMNLFRASAAVDYTKFSSWCISHGVSDSFSMNSTLAQSSLRLAYYNAKDLSSHL